MRNQAESKQAFTPGVIPSASWRITKVHTLPGYRLLVKFEDGTTGEVDLSRIVLGGKAGIFAALRDPMLFADAYVEYGAVM
jgi:hypothetical protein